jgi:DNA-binding SARP family transcriptional activator
MGPARAQAVGGADRHGRRLQLVGAFTVSGEGRARPAAKVGSRKARVLLALLAVERSRLVPVDEISEAVWAGSPPRLPNEGVATLVSRLRAVLGTDAILGGRAGYRLGPGWGVDLSEAAAIVAEAEDRLAGGEHTLALVTAGRALDLLGDGPVLADMPDVHWASPARVQHADLLRRAQHTVGRAAVRVGDPRQARVAAEALLASDPYDEVAYRILMRSYVGAGEPTRALATYQQLRSKLGEELGADPAPATRDLYVDILRERTDNLPATTIAEPGFVGRKQELARLAEAWTAAARGRSRLLMISGEAGIGKTRLVEQLARLAGEAGGYVVHARCHHVDRSLPLHPILGGLTRLMAGLPAAQLREAAGDRANALATLIPELGTALGVAAADLGCQQAGEHQCQEALVVFLRRLSARRPLLLALDDAHDADPQTVRLLHALARDDVRSRTLIVASVRAEEVAALAKFAAVAGRLPLGPLATVEVAELARWAGQTDRAEPIAKRTGGHTMLVVEMLRAAGTELPEPVRVFVLARVRRAGPDAAELLQAAAVIGPRFTPTGIASLLGIDEPEAARRCERIAPTGLILLAGNGYAFASEIVRAVLYEATPSPTRIAYHRRTIRPMHDRATPAADPQHRPSTGRHSGLVRAVWTF